MVNVHIGTLHDPDGSPVANVGFDLSAQQLTAVAHATGEILVERHRGQALEIDDVLALRELTGVRDEVALLAEGEGHARVVLTLGRFIALHDAVDEWVTSRAGRDWLREADEVALPFAGALLAPMAALRGDAVAAALGAGAAAPPA